jgi:general secretion pathway protein D
MQAAPMALLIASGLASTALCAPTSSPAQSSLDASTTVIEMSVKEMQRREVAKQKAEAELRQAQQSMALKDYDAARQHYNSVLNSLPESRQSARERAFALAGLRDASILLAKVRISEGRYTPKAGQKVDSAEEVLRTLLERDPQNKSAIRLLEQLYSPGYYNKTISPSYRAEVADVQSKLLEAQGFYDTGRFDLAIKRADQVLDIDPYNSAARKMQEMANNSISKYGEDSYNEARSRAMRNVEKAWASPIKRFGTVSASTPAPQMIETSKIEKLKKKLESIYIPEIEFSDKPLDMVAAALTQLSRQADKSGDEQKGVLIIANFPGATSSVGGGAAVGATLQSLGAPAGGPAPGGAAYPPVSIPKIPNFALSEILKIIATAADVKWAIKEKYVEFVPKTVQTDTLVLQSWTVSPFMFSSTAPKVDDLSSTGLGATLAGNSGSGAGSPKSTGRRRIDAKEFLQSMNVRFDAQGSTATYNPRTKVLTVYNSPDMLQLVDYIVADSDGQSPVQVDIQAKFVEFSQNNLKELSFDWLLGQSKFANSNVYTGGGTPKVGTNSQDYPFVVPSASALPNAGSPTGAYPVTAGNRSTLSTNAIDALLSGIGAGASTVAPGMFSVASAMTDPQFQVVVRALNQAKGVDLLSSPSITAKDQEEATIEIVREFRYPTEFTPPQIPQTSGAATAGAANQAAPPPVVVTPTTPSAFDKRNTGVTLKVTPSIKGDNYAIDLDLKPEVIEFEGFINYGSPIQTVSISAVAGIQTPTPVTLTQNVINQPIFSVRRIQTNVTLLDGETIALGGLIREDVQKINDKVPVLGDIPLVGRLFRSNVDQHIKKNLTIFVTARIMDASGQPIKTGRAEMEPAEEVPSLTGDALSMPR